MEHLDFKYLSGRLLSQAMFLVPSWLPGGRTEGAEYVVRNPTRQDKKAGSFRINLRTGRWADFATNDKGSDLISLYAYINGIKNGEAAKRLSMGC